MWIDNRIAIGWAFGQSRAILLLSEQLAASTDFLPFTKILTRPSFVETYLGHEDELLILGGSWMDAVISCLFLDGCS